MRTINFYGRSFDQYSEWAIQDKKIFQKLREIITEVRRTPFSGTGKPEALKHDLQGCWSRRITLEHRLVYRVTDDSITIISCYDHY
jgi:toxin YoeB